MSDDTLRASCFASLDVLCATYGEDLPYRGGLDAGFAFRGRRVPFLSPQKGIYRAAAQEGSAALSINTSVASPYDDEETADGFFYAYHDGSVDQPDNRALRAAYAQEVPLIYFIATQPGRYKPLYPAYVIADDPVTRRVLVSPGRMVGPVDERSPRCSTTRSIASTPYARRESDSIRPGSAVASFSPIRTDARSAISRKRAYSTLLTSSATSR